MKRAAARVAREIAEALEHPPKLKFSLVDFGPEGRLYSFTKADLQRWLLLLAPPQRKPRVKATPAKVATKALDKLCKEVVFARDGGVCRKCGKPAVDWSHCYSRRYKWLRWELSNSWASCKGCHLEFHHRPAEGIAWWESELTEKGMYELGLLAAKPRKTDPKLVKLYLESQRRLYE